MIRISEKELSERFKDREGMLEALRQAGRLARLRREMWARFRESIEAESPKANGAAPPTPPPCDSRDRP